MIKIQLGQPPQVPDYQAFVKNQLAKNETSFALPNYFRQLLYRQLNNTCSYLAISFEASAFKSSRSIDHFAPINALPNLRYEWTNFRLCHISLNKSLPDSWPTKEHELIDPADVEMKNNWFFLCTVTGRYMPSSKVPAEKFKIVQSTCGYLNKFEFPAIRLAVVNQYRRYQMAPKSELKALFPGIYYALEEFPA